MKVTPTTHVSGGIVLHGGEPISVPPQDPYTQLFYLLFVVYFLTGSKFGCLPMLAKPYPVSRPTHMPRIPDLLHCMSKGAHEVLENICAARLMSVFHRKTISFVLSWLSLYT